jgi:nucleoside phosphorylase
MPFHESTKVANGFPLVGERSVRRSPLPELGRDTNRERQSRYCQGFDPDWWIPALLAPKWRSYHYPLEATEESVRQWLALIDAMRVEYLGPFGKPNLAAELEADMQNDLELIRQCRPNLGKVETTEFSEAPTHSATGSLVASLLSEAESRRRLEEDKRRSAEERERRLQEHAAHRARLADAFERLFRFTNEETQQGRKPCPDGFRRWAERFIELGTILRECDEAIDGLRLAHRLRKVAEQPAPAAMKYACAVVLLGSEGKADAVALALEKANRDRDLRRFVLWLPFILDNLWHPFPNEKGLVRMAMSPDGTNQEQNEQAEQAFGWRALGIPTNQDNRLRAGERGVLEASASSGGPEQVSRDQSREGRAKDSSDSIIARAREVAEQQAERERRLRLTAENNEACQQAVRDYSERVGALFRAFDPWDRQEPPDPERFLTGIFASLTNACRVLRSCGFDERWRRIDREATFNHYRSSFPRTNEAKVAFEWGCRLLDRGFHDELREEDIETAWQEPALRSSYNMAEILLNGVIGRQRVEYQGDASRTATSSAQDATEATSEKPGCESSSTRAPNLGIITALPEEFDAVRLMLANFQRHRTDGSGGAQEYGIGEIVSPRGGVHSVVLARTLTMGNSSAALRAQKLLADFPTVESIIMCGIAGGVPNRASSDDHVRLGDIVVSDRRGVIQYDFGKQLADAFEVRSSPRPPSAKLLEAVHLLEEEELAGHRPWTKLLEEALQVRSVSRPNEATDVLLSNKGRKVAHPSDPRPRPRVFHGPIASSNAVQGDATRRDALRDKFKVKAVEMEGSGVADATWEYEKAGYLVVRGICDYCDARNKGSQTDKWKYYAAMAAAAYLRALLEVIPGES